MEENCNCGPSGECLPMAPREYDVTDYLLWEAGRARAELYREKIKKHLEAKRGKVIDQVAEALADYLSKAAETRAEGEGLHKVLRDKVHKILGGE